MDLSRLTCSAAKTPSRFSWFDMHASSACVNCGLEIYLDLIYGSDTFMKLSMWGVCIIFYANNPFMQ